MTVIFFTFGRLSLPSMESIDRQPSYLEEDSPSKRGGQKLLQIPPHMLEIPARDIDSAVLNKMPATPRSKKIFKEISQRNDDKEIMQIAERHRKIQTSLLLRKVQEAREKQVKENRQAMAPQRLSAKKTGRAQPRYMENSIRKSSRSTTSVVAKQYLQSQESPRGGPPLRQGC